MLQQVWNKARVQQEGKINFGDRHQSELMKLITPEPANVGQVQPVTLLLLLLLHPHRLLLLGLHSVTLRVTNQTKCIYSVTQSGFYKGNQVYGVQKIG